MVIDKIAGNIFENGDFSESKIVYVDFEWFELEKKRLKKIAPDQTEFGIIMEIPLKHGDILLEKEEMLYVVNVRKTKLIKAFVKNRIEMGRLCFELGNRHLSIGIEESYVRVPYDDVTFRYLKHLGFRVESVTERFEKYIVCKAHSFSH